MRKKVFIGTHGDDTIYYDSVNQQMVKVEGLKRIDMKSGDKAGSMARDLSFGLGLIFSSSAGWIISTLNIKFDKDINNLNIIIVYIGLFLGMIVTNLFAETRYNPHHQHYIQATKEEYRKAIAGNNIYRNYRKSSFRKRKLKIIVSDTFMVLIFLVMLYFIKDLMGSNVSFLNFMIVPLFSIGGGVLLVELIQLNKLRYVKIEQLVKAGKVKFKEDNSKS